MLTNIITEDTKLIPRERKSRAEDQADQHTLVLVLVFQYLGNVL